MPERTFAVTYHYVPEMVERRTPHRPDHLAHLKQAAEAGRLLLAGAYADPVDGALLVVQAEHAGEVYGWVASDPYARAGLIQGVAVREVNVAIRADGPPSRQ